MTKRFIFILWGLSVACGSETGIDTVSIALNQLLTAFDSDDTLSLWVYNEQLTDCAQLLKGPEDLEEGDQAFISKDTVNANALAAENASTSFDITNLPADIPLAFMAEVTDNSSGEVLTFGCNSHEAIGAGNTLQIEIILPKTE